MTPEQTRAPPRPRYPLRRQVTASREGGARRSRSRRQRRGRSRRGAAVGTQVFGRRRDGSRWGSWGALLGVFVARWTRRGGWRRGRAAAWRAG
uniref:Uncharacterized protein n=1 Tax=Zea mays TaxID=4577 RepID=C4J560_MAIZE|nr:unknown [Zea mays]